MAIYRELAVTTDPSIYSDAETNDNVITAGFNVANDWLVYASAATHSPAFRTLRVNSFNYAPNRDVMNEESFDNVSQSYIMAGAYSLSGAMEANFRGWDFHLSSLLLGAMGNQTPASVALSSSHKAGYSYSLAQTPATLALKMADEQGNGTVIFRGVGVTSFELQMQMKAFCVSSFNWIGKRAEPYDVGYNTGSAISGDPSPFYNPTLLWTPSGSTAEIMKCKGFTMTINRPMDQENMYLGSPFLQGLYYNGLSTLGGTITLGPGDWQRIRTMMAGDLTNNVLDEGKREFYGTVETSTVLSNEIPTGKFDIILHSPDGTTQVTKITADVAKLTEASIDASGRNMFNKTVNWQAQINSTDTFTIEVYEP
ncbi:MAG: phage tail tube protein [Dehalococcoidales bacterium]|jgi:hypothetical protein